MTFFNPLPILVTSSEAGTLSPTLAKCWRTFSCLFSRPPSIHSPTQSSASSSSMWVPDNMLHNGRQNQTQLVLRAQGDQHFITSTYLCALTGLSPQEVGFVGIMATKWKAILDLGAAKLQICAFEQQAFDSWYLIQIPFSAKQFKTYLFIGIYNTTCHWIRTCQPRPCFKTSYALFIRLYLLKRRDSAPLIM